MLKQQTSFLAVLEPGRSTISVAGFRQSRLPALQMAMFLLCPRWVENREKGRKLSLVSLLIRAQSHHEGSTRMT